MSKSESIPDEEWERFLKEAGAGTQSAPKEPSARARMVTRRLQEESGQQPGWRTYQPPRRRLGNKGWYATGLLAASGLLVFAVGSGMVAGWFGDNGGSGSLAAESERPDQPPATASGPQPTVKEPFRGSPAARWADGEAGIHLPAVRATGWMTKDQVAQALERTRDFLVASSLRTEVLRGERPTEAIALINPHQQDVQSYLATAFSAPSRDDDPLKLVSRFDEADVRLVGDVVKTRGRVTFREGRRGAVEVSTDVTYVYPLARADAGGDEVARTIVRREIVAGWDNPDKVITERGTFSLVSYKSDTTNGGCDTYTGYFSPEFHAERTEGAGEGPAVDPYDRSRSIDARQREADDATCGSATRS